MPGYRNLVILNRLDEILIPKTENPVVRVAAVTTRAGRARSPAGGMEEDLIREIRIDRIKQTQEEEVWIAGMKKYLSGSIADLTQAEARSGGKIAADYEIDELVAPETLQSAVLHHYHTTSEGGRQGVGRTYQRIRDHFHWRGYIGMFSDMWGNAWIAKQKKENRSHKGNTELLIWVDLFTGYVIAKASSSPSGQTVAESSLKMYGRDLDQRDWDEYAERLTFAINTAHDRIRGDTPHYLVHVWDPTSTLEATLPQAREQVNARLKEAIADRPGRHNEDVGSHQIEAGSRILLYLDRVKEGYARKLAHLWHGPFRVAEKITEFSVKLEIAGTGYQIFPVVHLSKLKLVKDFPDRPRVELTRWMKRIDSISMRSCFRRTAGSQASGPDLGYAEWEEDAIWSDLPRIPDPAGEVREEHISFVQITFGEIRSSPSWSWGKLEIRHPALTSMKLEANHSKIIVQLSSAGSPGVEIQADLIALRNRLISGRVAIDEHPIPILGSLGELLDRR
ncbi:hypothetical protein PHMEG_00027562, partial [Phytophthora megakarya]